MAGGGGDAEVSRGTPNVFISYASQDIAVANTVVAALEARGLKCWIAPRDVIPGQFYAGAIVHAIDAAKVVALVLSKRAATSQHVLREVERASSKRLAVVALRLDLAPLPADLEYFLNSSHWLDASQLGVATVLPKFVDAVQLAAGDGRRGATVPVAVPGDTGVASKLAAANLTQEGPIARPAGRRLKRTVGAVSVLMVLGLAYFAADRLWFLKRPASERTVTTESPVASPATPTVSEKSIAVLPFTDMSESKDQEYFADGMAEEILNLLVKIPELKVIGRTSSFQFKGKADDLRRIGTSLGAAYIVEGSVRRYRDHLRVTAQLIDTHTAAHLWAESYDRDLGDVLALQSQIATSIARALQLAMGADDTRPPRLLRSTDAYTLYLRGRSAYDGPVDIPEAQSDFEQALALDPSFLRAAEALAWMYSYAALTQEMQSPVAWPRAKDAAEKALRIDSDSAPAHAVLGLMHAEYEYDWEAADAEFRNALALTPRDPTTLDFAARLACHRGRYEEALRLIDAALAVDPLNPRAHRRKGFILYLSGDARGAQREYRRSLEIIPTFDWDHMLLAWILVARGEHEAALNEIQAESVPGARDQGLSIIYHAVGRNADSDAALARLIKELPDWGSGVALAYAYRGERDKAFEWLATAYTERDADLLLWIKGHPFLAPLRHDPRYAALLHKMNLAQ